MPTQNTYAIYVREESGLPKLITSVEAIPTEVASLDYVAVARFPFREKDNGLPVDGELSRVNKLEAAIEETLKPLGAFFLGHITFKGAMQSAWLAGKGIPSEVALKTGLLKKETIPLDVRHDPLHSWFFTELAPTPVEIESSRNRQLHQTLAEHNDSAEAVRQVDFWAYFQSERQRTAFVEAITANGYRLSKHSAAEGTHPFGCEFAADSDVMPETMATRCAFLRKEALLQDGDFDGWACPVIKK